jgi:hypothetical protein
VVPAVALEDLVEILNWMNYWQPLVVVLVAELEVVVEDLDSVVN